MFSFHPPPPPPPPNPPWGAWGGGCQKFKHTYQNRLATRPAILPLRGSLRGQATHKKAFTDIIPPRKPAQGVTNPILPGFRVVHFRINGSLI